LPGEFGSKIPPCPSGNLRLQAVSDSCLLIDDKMSLLQNRITPASLYTLGLSLANIASIKITVHDASFVLTIISPKPGCSGSPPRSSITS